MFPSTDFQDFVQKITCTSINVSRVLSVDTDITTIIQKIIMFRKPPESQGPRPKRKKRVALEPDYWDPTYLDRDSSRDCEYKNEWKQHLALQNINQISNFRLPNSNGIRFAFYGVEIVDCIFQICNYLKQPPEVRYLAVDMFDRFLNLHFMETIDRFHKLGKSKWEWKDIATRIRNQSLLRILSTICLAAKYCYNSQDISVSTVEELLNELGRYKYTKTAIFKSELRVYQTLNFNVPMVTPLTYVEMFFEDFSNRRELGFPISLSRFLTLCTNLLDVAIAYHKQIYGKLWFKMKGRLDQTQAEKLKFLAIEGDYIYLASGVIRAAAILPDPTVSFADRITEMMYSSTQYKKPEIEVLSSLIMDIILS